MGKNSLSINLSGKASTVFSTRIPTDKKNDYEVVMTVLLDAFGDTVDMIRQQWWTLGKTADESFQDCMIRIEEKFKRGLESCSTHFDYITTLFLSKFTSLLSADCKCYVLGANPKDGMAAAHLADEFYQVKPWKLRSSYSSWVERKDNDYSIRANLKKDWVRSEQISGQDRQPNNYLTTSQKDKDRKNYTNGGVTCYGCGKPGHKKPDCSNKVRRLRLPKPKGNIIVNVGQDWRLGVSKDGEVDSGADMFSVHLDYVPKALYTGDHTTIKMVDGTPRKCPLAKVEES